MEYTTFEDYINGEYYNLLYGYIKYVVVDNKDSIKSRGMNYIFHVDVEDFYIKSIRFNDVTCQGLLMDLIIQVDVAVKGYSGNDYREDICPFWVEVSATAIFDGEIKRFEINKCYQYKKDEYKKESKYSGLLVPILYKKDVDKEAELFLSKYYPEALKEPTPINVSKLADNMGLIKEDAQLSDNIFGMTYFDEGYAYVYGRDWNNPDRVHIQAGTILINPNTCFMRSIGSYNNTVVHECVHWDRHQLFFKFQKFLNNNLTHIECEVSDKPTIKGNKIKEALGWMEWQANILTPHIMMPSKQAIQKFEEILNDTRELIPNGNEADINNAAVKSFAHFFDVSILAARIRLMELGYDFLEGSEIYINGKKRAPFSFKKGSLPDDKTFLVDEKNTAYLLATNRIIRDLSDSGAVIYVDGLFCIDDDKYVIHNEGSAPELTNYASNHVDECCLVFDRKTKSEYKYGSQFYRVCSLCREIKIDDIAEPIYDPDYEDNQDKQKRAEAIVDVKEKLYKRNSYINKLNGMDFAGCLMSLMDYKKLSVEELSDRSKLSTRSLNNYRNSECKIDLESILALCIGMNLNPEFSYLLIQKGGYTLRPNEIESIYKYLIDFHYDETIHAWNQTLKDFKVNTKIPKNYKKEE